MLRHLTDKGLSRVQSSEDHPQTILSVSDFLDTCSATHRNMCNTTKTPILPSTHNSTGNIHKHMRYQKKKNSPRQVCCSFILAVFSALLLSPVCRFVSAQSQETHNSITAASDCNSPQSDTLMRENERLRKELEVYTEKATRLQKVRGW